MLGPRFWTLFAASTASNVGDGVLLAALPLLARRLTDDPLAISSVTAAATMPWLVFGFVAGAIVDRTDRVRLLVRADVARAVLMAVFAVLVVTGQASLAVVLGVVTLLGIAETLFDTAAQAVIPAVVAADQLELANGRLFGAQLAGNSFVGPPLGAALFVAVAAAPFALDAATFALSALLVARLPRTPVAPPATGSSSLLGEVREGLAWLWSDPGVRAFAVGAAAVNLAHTSVMAIVVLFVRDDLGVSGTGFGFVLAGTAVGGLVGTQIAPAVVARVGRRRAVVGAIIVFAASLVLAGSTSSVAVTTGGLATFGLAGEVWNVVAVSYRQARVPDALLGRVMASYRVLAYGAMPTGALLGGAVASAFGLRAPFFVGAAIVTVLLLWFLPATRGEVLQVREE